MTDEIKKDDVVEEEEFLAAEDMTLAELKEEAIERELDIKGIRSKKGIIEVLEAADLAEEEAAKDDEPLKGGERPKRKAKTTPEDVEDESNPDEAENAELGRQDPTANDTQDALLKGSDEKPAALETSIDVVKGNAYIRTYSMELHGEGYMNLAKDFINKVAGRELLKAGQFKSIKVSYRARSKAMGVFYTKTEVFTGRNFKNDALAFAAQVKGTCEIV